MNRTSPWALVAAGALIIVAGFVAISSLAPSAAARPSQSPESSTVSPTASPSPAGNVPYRVSIQTTPGSAGPTTTISQPSDCNVMPSDWLLQVCGLALRPDWQSIIAATDPLGPAAPVFAKTSVSSVTWWAALTRATIDGDTSLCSDASMRWWITLGSGLGGAPQPGATPAPLHPVASCLNSFRSTIAEGSFTLTDQSHLPDTSTVSFFVSPDASAQAGLGSAPAFDPSFGCDYRSMTRETCNDLLAAILPVLGDRESQVDRLVLRGGSLECTTSSSPCPPPSGGTWLGNVVALTGQSTGFAFDVAEIDGQIVTTEVPYQP
ncbi:MAG TPA: hypothetical protein VID26_05870 [Candidatus Limnocylindrales bacterium]